MWAWGLATGLTGPACELVYSTTEYAVWYKSAHVDRIDCQLNKTMRIITASEKSTYLPWLPVLANITTPAGTTRSSFTQDLVRTQKTSGRREITECTQLNESSTTPSYIIQYGRIPRFNLRTDDGTMVTKMGGLSEL